MPHEENWVRLIGSCEQALRGVPLYERQIADVCDSLR